MTAIPAMGGKRAGWWYLGARPGDKGRQFHRPDEIGIFWLRDMAHDSAAHPGKENVTAVYVTSPRFATAEGIAPGSTLAAILANYPNARRGGAAGEEDDSDDSQYWPLYGLVEFYRDQKLGIGFAIQKSTSRCIQISVLPIDTPTFFRWFYPLAATDYVIDNGADDQIGDIKLNMTAADIITLLGKPDQTGKAVDLEPGVWWRWRVPAQGKDETPGLSIYMRRLSDGSLFASQIRVTSPAFIVTDKVYPGCPLKDMLEAVAGITKIDAIEPKGVALYGAPFAGLMFEANTSTSTCTAISIIPAPLR